MNEYFIQNLELPGLEQKMEQILYLQQLIDHKRIVIHGQNITRISSRANKYREHLEILVRIITKDGSLLLSDFFIPQFEQTGLIASLDKLVLEEVIKMIENRHRTVKYLTTLKGCLYHINLSAKSICDESFIAYCRELLTTHQYLAPCLCFEVSENEAISNVEETRNFIKIIHSLGAKFALDNFGSGGASLEGIKELNLDFIKFDGSFISDIFDNQTSQLIVRSVCKISKLLKIDVITAKVETEEAIKIFSRLGVHYVQGFKVHQLILMA